jgi:RHS repeat-associated protein
VRGRLQSGTDVQGGTTRQSLYRYDPDGIRQREEVSTATAGINTNEVRLLVVDHQSPTGYAQVVEERTESGLIVASYVYGIGFDPISVAQILQPVGLYLADGYSGVRQVVNLAAITVFAAYRYDSFGNLMGSAGAFVNPVRYRGERFDLVLGQYYLRARLYDQASGRFTGMDEFLGDVQNPITMHKYLYAGNNPIEYFDPSGRSFFSSAFFTSPVVTWGTWSFTAFHLSIGAAVVGVPSLLYGYYRFARRRQNSVKIRIHENLTHQDHRVTLNTRTEVERIFNEAATRFGKAGTTIEYEWLKGDKENAELGRHYGWFWGQTIDVSVSETSPSYDYSVMGNIRPDAIAFTQKFDAYVITGRIAREAKTRGIPSDILMAWIIAHEIGHHAIGGANDEHPHQIGFIDAVNGPRIRQQNPLFSDEGGRAFVNNLGIYLK